MVENFHHLHSVCECRDKGAVQIRNAHSIFKQAKEHFQHEKWWLQCSEKQRNLLMEFMARRTTLASEVYCEMFNKLQSNKINGTESSLRMSFFCMTTCDKTLLKQFKLEIINHPLFSLDLASCEYHHSTRWRYNWPPSLQNRRGVMDEQLVGYPNSAILWWEIAKSYFIHAMVRKCPNLGGDYMEKYSIYVCKFCI